MNVRLSSRPRLLLPAASLAALALVVTGCTSPSADAAPEASADAATIVVEDARPTLMQLEEGGETYFEEDTEIPREAVEVAASPDAVVTFDIATLDTLDAIGAGDAVVGIPDIALPDYLSEYADLPTVGTLFEAVAGLEPDLIVTAARSTGQYDALAEIATTIDLTGTYGGTFDPAAGLRRAAQLGEIFGAEETVEAATARIEELESAIEDRVDATALVLSVSGGEYGAFGEGSRFGYFFDTLGFTPAVPTLELPGAEASPHGDTVTNEFLLEANPDWIIAFDRGAATGEGSSAAETLDNELVERTTAGAEDHIILLPASELYIVINGLTAIENVLTTIDTALAA